MRGEEDRPARNAAIQRKKSLSNIYANSALANEALVNITRPSPDLIVSFSISVSYSSDVEVVKKALDDVLTSHPDVLGSLHDKMARIASLIPQSEGKRRLKLENGLARLAREQVVDREIQKLNEKLVGFAGRVQQMRQQGYTPDERLELQGMAGDLLCCLKGVPDMTSKGTGTLVREIDAWSSECILDPDLKGHEEDRVGIKETWDRRVKLLEKKLNPICSIAMQPVPDDERLPDDALQLKSWLLGEFKAPTPTWKHPDINLLSFGDSAIEFEVEFFVDNINLEHFERKDRVLTEIRESILDAFRSLGIEMPFPQRDVWFRNQMPVLQECSCRSWSSPESRDEAAP